jgi:hypothetical protein
MAGLSPTPKQQIFGSDGAPLVGGKIYTYLAGTSTPAATYTDYSAGTANTNPIILDSYGQANIWLLSSTSYKFIVKTATDVLLYTVDNISTPLDISALASPPPIGNTTPNTGAFTTLSASGAVTLTGLGAMKLNAGTTAERPTPSNGMIRYNTSTPSLEGYVNGAWANIPSGSVVTSVATGTGLTGGPITSTGTIAIDSTVATLTGTQTLTNKTIQGGAITSGTVVSVSGATVDFTSIPSWVKRVTIAMQSISTNGTSSYILRIGNSTFTTTGYVSVMNYVAITGNSSTGDTSTTGFLLTKDGSSSTSFTALATIVLQSSGFYICTFTGMNSGSVGFFGTSYLNLGSVLDRVRLTTVNGTDTFDAGSINILYE